MRRQTLWLLALLLPAALTWGGEKLTHVAPGLASYLLGQTDRTYSVNDLPAGWPWDSTKIKGTLLPALHDPLKAANDPDLWLVPCGLLTRWGPTNDWVKEVRIVSVEGTTTVGLAAFVDQDANTKKSKTWRLEAASVPGPWYIVVDAVSQPGKNGQPKVNRYTIVGAGYVPDEYLPFLW